MQTVNFSLKPSQPLAWIWSGVAFCIIGGIATASLPLWLKGLLMTAIVISLGDSLLRYCWLKHPKAILACRHLPQAWQLRSTAGAWIEADLTQDAVVWPGVMLLRFKTRYNKRLKTVFLTSAMLPTATWRALRWHFLNEQKNSQ